MWRPRLASSSWIKNDMIEPLYIRITALYRIRWERITTSTRVSVLQLRLLAISSSSYSSQQHNLLDTRHKSKNDHLRTYIVFAYCFREIPSDSLMVLRVMLLLLLLLWLFLLLVFLLLLLVFLLLSVVVYLLCLFIFLCLSFYLL